MKFNLILATIFITMTTLAFTYRSANGIVEAKPLNIQPNGSVIYKTKCIACHNVDPSKDGKLGPAIANSSFELLKARTQFRSYPAGYKPKRKTKLMPKIKLSDEQIKALEAFLMRK